MSEVPMGTSEPGNELTKVKNGETHQQSRPQ
jgi:hypothetical protein